MKAIALVPHTQNVSIAEFPEPRIENSGQVKVKVLQVGVCGTDRIEVAGGHAEAPKGEARLIIGHEMLGRVVEAGSSSRLKPGDLVVAMVRRPCNECSMCRKERSDLCETGHYTERGIKERHGFQSEYIVDDEKYMVRVPSDLKSIGVLTEPMTIAENAIETARKVQCARLPIDGKTWLTGKKALVAGLGPVGLLAALALSLRGAQVFGLDRAPPESLRAKLLSEMGGRLIEGAIDPQFDLILEASGSAKLQFDIVQHLKPNGICVLTGIPETAQVSLDGGQFMSRLVLRNQAVVGVVNAAREHFEEAAANLAAAQKRWPGLVERLITSKTHYSEFKKVFDHRSPDEIKAVIEWE